jgi:DNA-binding HxlR family transcriptional regulator
MTSKRLYSQACSAAHALDLVGERWALLVVRELLLGPKRFTDLRAGLPDAGPNVLSQRLRELDSAGVVRRRKLAPPAGSWVYELTEWGLELEPVLVHLARWGARSPLRDLAAGASVDALMLAFRSGFDVQSCGDLTATCALRIGEHSFVLDVDGGHLHVTRGEAATPHALIESDAATFAALMARGRRLGEATTEGRVTVTGDATVVERLLRAVTPPDKARVPSP